MTWGCSETGLILFKKAVTMFRVASSKPGRGPLNPLGRQSTNIVDRGSWSRYDVGPADALAPQPGYTIYGASCRDTAFTEVLSWKAATSQTFAGLYEEAKFTDSSIDELLADLRKMGAPIGQVDPAWCSDRRIYTLKTEPEIWVDPTYRDNLAIIAGLVGGSFRNHRRLTTADITGDDRMITTSVAEALRNLSVRDAHDNPTRIFGIRYLSKFGTTHEDDYCWAAWLRNPNEGISIHSLEPMTSGDPDVATASRITGVYVP